MQITQETIQLQTPFIFTTDKCSCCGEPYGHDEFEILLPLLVESNIPKNYKWRPDAYKHRVDILVDELNKLFLEDPEKVSDEDKEIVQGRIFEIMEELNLMGTFITTRKYKLKAEYEVGQNDAVHCIISYIEQDGPFLRDGVLFQANLNTIEDLAKVFEFVSKGLDVDSIEMNEEELFDYDDEDDDYDENHMLRNHQ